MILKTLKKLLLILLISVPLATFAAEKGTDRIEKKDQTEIGGHQDMTPNAIFNTCSVHAQMARALWHQYLFLNDYFIDQSAKATTIEQWKVILEGYIHTFYTDRENGAKAAAMKMLDMLFSEEFINEMKSVEKEKGVESIHPYLIGELVFTACIGDLQEQAEQNEKFY